ncbi:hypothetical protein VKT23_014381 [Stygiomarasmius scandens]|uniref:Uncharacterized protein n=1 Tax=Marasmiellus scandens TaxID=2682957 RepID=A0ABR1J2Y4_9AGAR
MPSAPSLKSAPIPTFSLPRSAPRPKVIPLFATSIPRRAKRPLSIHQSLRSKPHHHPYAYPVSAAAQALTPHQQSRSQPSEKTRPPPIIISSAAIESPLTSVEDNPNLPAPEGGSSREAQLQLIPPPHSSVTVANAGWSATQQQSYRVWNMLTSLWVLN